MTSVYIVNDV